MCNNGTSIACCYRRRPACASCWCTARSPSAPLATVASRPQASSRAASSHRPCCWSASMSAKSNDLIRGPPTRRPRVDHARARRSCARTRSRTPTTCRRANPVASLHQRSDDREGNPREPGDARAPRNWSSRRPVGLARSSGQGTRSRSRWGCEQLRGGAGPRPPDPRPSVQAGRTPAQAAPSAGNQESTWAPTQTTGAHHVRLTVRDSQFPGDRRGGPGASTSPRVPAPDDPGRPCGSRTTGMAASSTRQREPFGLRPVAAADDTFERPSGQGWTTSASPVSARDAGRQTPRS